MRAVNLLPKDAKSSNSFLTEKNLPALVGGGTGFLVIVVLAALFLSASSKVSAAQGDYDAAQAQLAATPLPPAPTEQPTNTTPTAVVNEHAPRLQALSAVLGQRIAWDRVLREFSQVLPGDVWISSLSMAAPTVPGATDGFSISATTYSYASVARMLSRMALVPDLTAVDLKSTARSGRLVQFTVSASIKGAAAPVAPAAPAAPVPSTDTTQTDTTSSDAGASS
jgi:Tfp pilus assembly protein PilN